MILPIKMSESAVITSNKVNSKIDPKMVGNA
jgi:hypothetical protein